MEIFIFPVQLITSRIGNLTRLIHTLAICVTIHAYIHKKQYLDYWGKSYGIKRALLILSWDGQRYKYCSKGRRERLIVGRLLTEDVDI